MKRFALIALCCLSSFASANDIEEVVVKAQKIEIALVKLDQNHKKNPVTGSWHYVEKKKESANKA